MAELVTTLDINKLLEAYNQPDFMKIVFTDFLKNNPDVVAKALGSYIIADLVKTDSISVPSEKVRNSMDVYLENLKDQSVYNSPIKQSINTLIVEVVKESKSVIDRKVSQVVANELTAKTISDCVTSMVNRRIIEVIGELSKFED